MTRDEAQRQAATNIGPPPGPMPGREAGARLAPIDPAERRPRSFAFGRFTLIPERQLLLCGDAPQRIGGRALDLLTALVERPGEVVDKRELMARVWAGVVVNEGSLKVNMASLRRALGDDPAAAQYIATVTGRGYRFVASVRSDGSRVTGVPDAPGGWLGDRAPVKDPGGGLMTNPCNEGGAGVVVIDDDASVCEALRGLFESVGLVARTYGSVQAFLATEPPDRSCCVVLDIRLPGQSGLEFQDALAKFDPHRSVVFISGHVDVHMAVRAMKAGAIDVLPKPVREQDLLEAVNRAMKQAGQRRRDALRLAALRSRCTKVTEALRRIDARSVPGLIGIADLLDQLAAGQSSSDSIQRV